ncbi:MAG: hypothetical protein WKF77_26975 [Planctomycetaceae bacterium]
MTKPVTTDGDTMALRSLSAAEHIMILAATGVIFAAILQAEPLQSANDRSRWSTVWSLVERGTFQIDEIDSYARWSTIDKVRYRSGESEPWHFYSSKPPLLSVIVAGFYAVERWTMGFGLFNQTALVTRGLLLIVNGLPFWFALRSLCRGLIVLDASFPVRMFVLAVAGFGSMLNPYLTTLNNHTPAAATTMFAITTAVEILATRLRATTITAVSAQRGRLFVALGFFASLTCCFELPAALLGVLSFILAVFIDRRLTLTRYLPAAVIPLAAFFITNWMATGGVKPFYATYGSDTYVYEHNGIPSYWTNPRDLDANQETPLVYLIHCVLGHHGLLSLTPVLCLSVCGWFMTLRGGGNAVRKWIILAGAVLTVITLGFYLTRTQNYNYGGNSVGLRWMLWLSPFWWLALVPIAERLKTRTTQVIAGLLLLVSITSVSWSLHRPWRPSWLYEQMQAAGWINYRTTTKPFDPPRTSVFATWPDKVGVSAAWHSSDHERLIVTTAESPMASGTRGRGSNPGDFVFRIELEVGGQKTVLQEIPRGFGDTTPESRADEPNLSFRIAKLKEIFGVEMLVSGTVAGAGLSVLPASENSWSGYNAAGTSWVPSAAEPTKAWKVERGAARVLVDDPTFGRCWHRCDVMYCDQMPFGVLQWKTTVTSYTTGEVLSTQTWLAEDH